MSRKKQNKRLTIKLIRGNMTYKETHQFYTNIRGFYCAVFCRIFCSILGSSFDIGSEGNDMSKLQHQKNEKDGNNYEKEAFGTFGQ